MIIEKFSILICMPFMQVSCVKMSKYSLFERRKVTIVLHFSTNIFPNDNIVKLKATLSIPQRLKTDKIIFQTTTKKICMHSNGRFNAKSSETKENQSYALITNKKSTVKGKRRGL